MARPRIFLSSTYFDFKTIREDLDRFISSLGFEAVRHELGHISYGREEKPEKYAYREIEYCDVLVSVIGGRFGSAASGSDYSISQQELKQAIELGKQVYIFVEGAVLSENKYYLANKDVKDARFSVDRKIHSFIEEVYALPQGNPIFSFDTGGDIVTILREQWAGLFQRLLQQESNRVQTSLTQELQRSLQTIDQLIKFLTEEKTKGDDAIQEILFSSHPIFNALRELLNNRYRLYFTNYSELEDWLTAARQYKSVEGYERDFPEYYEWIRTAHTSTGKESHTLYVYQDVFDENGRLVPFTQAQWNEDWIRVKRSKQKASAKADDDIPF